MFRLKALFPGLVAVLVAGFAFGDEAIPNWPAPATWSPHSVSRGVSTMGAITSPLPFIGVTPCRIADTRGNGFTGQYGPPALVANATRSFTIAGQCGIPASAAAVSFNFAALNVGAAGDLRVFPAGAGVPLVSTLNYNGNTPNIANAAVVPLGPGGAITVQADAVSIDLIIDVNGYYANSGPGGFLSLTRTTVVSPSGTATDNGTALLNALSGITTASAINPWLLKIEPGVYDFGSSFLAMKQFVDIEGSGELVTTLRSSGAKVVNGAGDAELRLLTVQNTNTTLGSAAGILSAPPYMRNVAVNVAGGIGIALGPGPSALVNLRVTCSGGGVVATCNGIWGGAFRVVNTTIQVSGGNIDNFGIVVGSGGGSLRGVDITVGSGAGVWVTAPTDIDASTIVAATGYGVDMPVASTAQVRNSTIQTSTGVGSGAINTVAGDTVHVSASQIDGGVVGGGAFACIGAFNGNYTPLSSTCN